MSKRLKPKLCQFEEETTYKGILEYAAKHTKGVSTKAVSELVDLGLKYSKIIEGENDDQEHDS